VIAIRGAREFSRIGKTLVIGLIPKRLGNKNLRTLLGKVRWTKLRHDLLPAALRCEACGIRARHSSELDAHEEWKYFTCSKPAIAKLTKITFLCSTCHGCAHFGWDLDSIRSLKSARFEAEVKLLRTRIEGTVLHYCRVNMIPRESFDRHLRHAKAQLKRLSKIRSWIFDWGQFAPLVVEKKARDIAQKNTPRVKLFLDPKRDRERPDPSAPLKRGPKPLFGRAMTRAEITKRFGYRKRNGLVRTIQDIKESKEAPVVVRAFKKSKLAVSAQ